MMTLCIVPCGKQKVWDKNPKIGPTKAKYVYTGPLARKAIEYARTFYPSAWRILSAKYGFLHPEDTIAEPYNISFNDRSTMPISVEQLKRQKEERGLDGYDEIVVLGGKVYSNIVKKVFQDTNVREPLAGEKIGFIMRKINKAIKEKEPL